jgi:hypothetical protein
METSSKPQDGWTFSRRLGMAIAVMGILGFGSCTACSVALMFERPGGGLDFFGEGLTGLGIGLPATVAFFLLAWQILREVDADETKRRTDEVPIHCRRFELTGWSPVRRFLCLRGHR